MVRPDCCSCESVQKRAVRTILPLLSYEDGFSVTGLETLPDHRHYACQKFINKLESSDFVAFNIRAGVLIRYKTRGAAERIISDKARIVSTLNGLKTIYFIPILSVCLRKNLDVFYRI